MWKRKSTSLLCLILVSLIAWLFQSGCGRSVVGTAMPKGTLPPKASTASPLKTTRQNLSMAKKLKILPSSEYVLGAEDTVEISVFRHDEMKLEATVSASGKLSYFLIGDIQAAGLTRFELRDKLKKELATFIKEPEVLVRITEYRSHKILVLGQVKNPGVYRMKNDFSLLEAISSAGGITTDAYLGGAYVVRDGKILLVNFVELIASGNTEENIPLLPGDVIYIPDNKDQKVFVLGEVNKQAAIPLRDRMTLVEAIAEAGGFTRDAKKQAIMVMRGNLSEPEIIEIAGERMDVAAGIPLQPGDIVYVASSDFANVERIAVRLSHILGPFYDLARTVVWGAAARDVFQGGETRFVIVE
jgi:polysaccharide export outer membrane protein